MLPNVIKNMHTITIETQDNTVTAFLHDAGHGKSAVSRVQDPYQPNTKLSEHLTRFQNLKTVLQLRIICPQINARGNVTVVGI